VNHAGTEPVPDPFRKGKTGLLVEEL
jgi:hypothetical protein